MHIRWAYSMVYGFALTVFLTGCGGGDTGVNVRKPPGERPDIDRTRASKGALSVPSSEAFNYTSFSSGQVGPSRGESAAVGKDGVHCAAQAGDGGSAWGEFQLGYCFDNTSGGPLDAAVKLKLKLTEAHSSNGPTKDARGAETTGKTALRFFIKDSNGQIVKSDDLSTCTLLKGPQSQTKMHDIVFDARFEPELGYYLMLTGRADAQAAADANANVAMDISEASMEIDWRPGNAKATAPDAADRIAEGTSVP